jgi:quercetin dioxygenase-like cupin family protein
MLTTHLVLKGEIMLQVEGKEKRTYKLGDRADVEVNAHHEAWMEPEVLL